MAIIDSGTGKRARHTLIGCAKLASITLLLSTVGCGAAVPVKRPSDPLVATDSKLPEDVSRQAERADRACGTKEAQLLFDLQEGKKEQESFKTVMGSITGGVGTAGGAAAGIGS